ncbi:hypothetical protein QYE76_049790 [Lolium multiflorum]|uniref:F-box domain-containing protein n=1 Tax=Lolium multiflorum TaxID=4521 RepID=A0AAD8WH78_LOLMU|nr:hypothetical protein QYE76_049790 [Lolium multiflorum]
MSAPAPITLGCKSVQGTSNGDDRLSSLPDAMLHHMMSFLPMPEVVHTSLLSPRWRYLWTSTPFVHIDHLDFQDDTGNWTEVDRIEKFMDQLLRLRDRTASYTTRKKLFSGAPLFPISGALLVRHYYHATAKLVGAALVRHNYPM